MVTEAVSAVAAPRVRSVTGAIVAEAVNAVAAAYVTTATGVTVAVALTAAATEYVTTATGAIVAEAVSAAVAAWVVDPPAPRTARLNVGRAGNERPIRGISVRRCAVHGLADDDGALSCHSLVLHDHRHIADTRHARGGLGANHP